MGFLQDIIGNTIVEIKGMVQDSDEIIFTLKNGDKWKMYHEHYCCERVWLEDINGTIENILNSPILRFDEKIQDDKNAPECGTFTFYTIATKKGYLDLRWHGESNGNYSESVNFQKIL
jgi:hypothetical protein